MAYTELEVRELVIEAGHRLLETGLIARTWGNISARISDTHFVITPSGLAYETLRPDQLVKVAMDGCTYDGPIKPSSEKGIHADAYRLRPQVQFVIHTHQESASIYGTAGISLPSGGILGRSVPCAAYGLSSTKKLRGNVTAAAAANPDCPAVLMRHHGALCMGDSYENAFQVAAALETACAVKIAPPSATMPAPDWGCSQRQGAQFQLELGGQLTTHSLTGELTGPAALHGAIYRRTDAQYILHEPDPGVTEISAQGRTLRPMLDDLAQIAGISLRCADPQSPASVAKALRGRNGVLLRGAGGLCTGKTREDADAARILLRKDCAAHRFSGIHPGCRSVGLADAWLERTIYVKKYAKKKG